MVSNACYSLFYLKMDECKTQFANINTVFQIY